MGTFEQFRQDAVYALRTLKQSPGFASIACITMILGIGATTALFSVLNAVVLRSLPYNQPDRLVHVLGDDPLDNRSGLPWQAFERLQSDSGPFSQVAAYYRDTGWSRVTFGGTDEPELMQAGFTTASFFTTMGVSPLLGRVFDDAEEKRRAQVAVLSASVWQRRFGLDRGIVGRTVEIDGRAFTVIGVMRREVHFPARDTQLWMPITTNRFWGDQPLRDEAHTRGFYMRWNVVGRLRPDATATNVREYLERLQARMGSQDPDWNMGIGVKAVPLGVELTGNARLGLFVLFGSVCLVLLIACANTANLMLARGTARVREFSVRTALGATQGRIMRQILTESLVLVAISGCGAVLLAQALIRVLVRYGPVDLPRLDEAQVDWVVVSFTIILSAAVAVLAGILPAIRTARTDPNEYIKAGGRTATSSKAMTRTGAVLVVSELSLAVLLSVACGLLVRSLQAVESVSLGFSADHVLTAQVRPPDEASPAQKAAFEDQVLTRVRSLPGIAFVGGIQSLFELDRPPENSLRALQDRPVNQRDHAALTWTTVSGEYFQATGVPLLFGRYFSEHDTANTPLVAIIDEAMAHRYWPNENPVGKRFKGQDQRGAHDDWITVIGVVGNARRQGLEQEPTPHVYEWSKQAGPVNGLVVRTNGGPAKFARSVTAAVHEVNPRAVVSEVISMREQIDQQTASRRFQTSLLSLFAGLALVLSIVGIYGVVSYATARRAHEMAIRIALGARRGSVLAMVLREGMGLAVCGLGIGYAAAVFGTNIVARLLYGVTATDPATFAGVGVAMLTVAAGAVMVPAWRATRVDPLVTLRAD